MNSIRHVNLFIPILGLLLCSTWFIYFPGLHGSFLFDDFANLPALGANGPINTWAAFWRYITSGRADPIGRPLSLLSFLLDANNWPTAAYPLKRTNLVLHLLNGILLALLLRALGRKLPSFRFANHRTGDASTGISATRRIDFAATLGAGFWLLHPLSVSTTLYIVQREAMLPATFTLLGLLGWLHGRGAMQRGHRRWGVIWIAIGLGGCTVLGVLSKANGILLPTLALVVEYVFLQACGNHEQSDSKPHADRSYRRVMMLFGWLPAALVATYLFNEGWRGLTRGISSVRPWTLGQRLLTEPRVLLDYLDLLWFPRPFTPGLFNDHILASTSPWSPMTTLPALLAVFALIAGAWMMRRRQPALALASLFFFVGHALESSTVALELYFEHRNYLPAMLMFWPLALWLCGVVGSARMGSSTAEGFATEVAPTGLVTRNLGGKAKLALAVVILLGLGMMTHARASLWGDSDDQALLWAKLNPDSPRAQVNAAQAEIDAGQPGRAANRLFAPLTESPDQVQLALSLFDAQCQLGSIGTSTLDAVRTALHTTRDPGTLLMSWFERAMEQVAQPPCPQLSYTTLASLLQEALANPHLATNPGRQQDIHYLLGRLALSQDDAKTALNEFNLALDLQVRTSAALKQAALLGASGFPQEGLAHLDHLAAEPVPTYKPGFGMPRIHAWVLQRQQYWPKELAHLRATLQDDASHQTRTAE